MPANFSTDPINGAERRPFALDPFTRPVFQFSPTEPSTGVFLLPDDTPFLLPNGEWLALPT